jgi:hypothetical protein
VDEELRGSPIEESLGATDGRWFGETATGHLAVQVLRDHDRDPVDTSETYARFVITGLCKPDGTRIPGELRFDLDKCQAGILGRILLVN